MKQYRQIAAIVTGVAVIFIAAELMPVAVSRSTDKKTFDRITTLEAQTTTTGIAYELSLTDKLALLGDDAEHTCTRIYHTESLADIKKYDSKVLDTLWETIDTFNQISAINRLEENGSTEAKKETDPVYIRLNRTDDPEVEQYFDEASCVSVSQSSNSMGTMTVWLLTFRQEDNTWQFLLDTAEKRLYAVAENDREKDGSGYSILEKKKKGMQALPATQYFRELCQLQMAVYYGGESTDNDISDNDTAIPIREQDDAGDTYEAYVPFQSACQLLDTAENRGISLKYGIGSNAFYNSLDAATGEYRLFEPQEIYDIHIETEEKIK